MASNGAGTGGAGDRVVRALTVDGAFRVVGAVTTETVRDASTAQEVGGDDARRLAELITGAILIRETTSPARRVQVALEDDLGRKAVADAHPDGMNRGLAGVGQGDTPPRGPGRLTVSYTLPNAELQQGIVAVPEGSSVSKALMVYLQESEQILSVLEVAARQESGGVRWAGGYVVQLLPEADREALAEMVRRLDLRAPLSGGAAPPDSAHRLVEELLAGFDHEVVAESPLRFGCTCNRERVLAALKSLGPDEIEAMVAERDPVEARCDACGATYEIAASSLKSP